jgi:hypothetical protein
LEEKDEEVIKPTFKKKKLWFFNMRQPGIGLHLIMKKCYNIVIWD